MSLVDDNEDIRVAQLQESWENTLRAEEALNEARTRISELEEDLDVAYESLKDLHDALQLVSSFVDSSFGRIRSGDWL